MQGHLHHEHEQLIASIHEKLHSIGDDIATFTHDFSKPIRHGPLPEFNEGINHALRQFITTSLPTPFALVRSPPCAILLVYLCV